MKHSFLFPLLFILHILQEKRQKSQKVFPSFFCFIKNYIFFDSLLTFLGYNKENINSQSNYKEGSAMSFIDEKEIAAAMSVKLDFDVLPEKATFQEGIRRAPDRGFRLTQAQTEIALKMPFALHSKKFHQELIPEFLEELKTRGRIYGYRFRPKDRIYGKPIDEYKGKCTAAKAMQVMIDNNLSFEIALYPYELVTYGETGSVCANWMQYNLIKKYLEVMTEDQTLVVESGHPSWPLQIKTRSSSCRHHQWSLDR